MRFHLLRKAVITGFAASIPFVSAFGANVPTGPNGYTMYSTSSLDFKQFSIVSGGAIGCAGNVIINPDVTIQTPITAKGSISIDARTNISGNVTAGGNVTISPNASVTGTVKKYQSVTAYTIPTRTVTVGTKDVFVAKNGTATAAPGNYNNLCTNEYGTLNLSSGTYNVNTFTVGNYSSLKLNLTSGKGITINVKTTFEFRDNAKMVLPAGNNGALVDIYYNGVNAIAIGHNAAIYGSITCPNAEATVMDRAMYQGALFAKKINVFTGVNSGNIVDQWLTIDTDRDGVPDYVETQIGTSGSIANDKPAVVVEGTYANKTQLAPQSVVLSVAHEIGYSRNKVPMSFAKGSLGGDLIPIVDIISKPDAVSAIPTENGDIRLDGVAGQQKIFTVKGTINPGFKVYMGFPLSDASVSIPREFLRIYHYTGTTWVSVPVDAVTNGIAYAYVTSYSYYAVGAFTNVIRVNPNFTVTPVGDFTSLTGSTGALSYISSHPNYATNKFVVLILGDKTSTYSYAVNENLPVRTSIIGGYASLPDKISCPGTGSATTITVTGMGSKFSVDDYIEISTGSNAEAPKITGISGDVLTVSPALINVYAASSTVRLKLATETELVSDPRKYPTIFKQNTGNIGPILELVSAAANPVEIFIDGITFKEGSYTGLDAAVYLSSGSHWTNLHITNCVFEKNTGERAAALYMFNVSNVLIRSCVFAENTCSQDYSGSAVYAYQWMNCGVGAKFESCVFYKNTNSFASPTDAATVLNTGNAEEQNANRFLEIYNCTFVANNGKHVIQAVDNASKLMPIENSIFFNNTNSGTDVVSPATYLPTGNSNTTADPIFVNATATGAKGPDGIWGTHDDGLQLTKGSPARNAVSVALATVPIFDATGRRRAPSQTNSNQAFDKGAYEKYINILNVGDINTFGKSTVANYEVYLKEKLESLGYLVDFVGPTEIPGGYNLPTDLSLKIGRDPSNNTDEGALDLQMGALNNGTLSNLSAKFGTFTSATFDFALLMIGSVDAPTLTTNATRTAKCTEIATFASNLASSTEHPGCKVIISCIPVDKNSDDMSDEIYRPFNTAFYGLPSSAFGSAIRISSSSDINIDGIISVDPNTNTVKDAIGYNHIASKFHAAILSSMP